MKLWTVEDVYGYQCSVMAETKEEAIDLGLAYFNKMAEECHDPRLRLTAAIAWEEKDQEDQDD